jgi:hypothetical protein
VFITALKRLLRRTPPAVVIYSAFDDYAHVSAALSLGARGTETFFLKKNRKNHKISPKSCVVTHDRIKPQIGWKIDIGDAGGWIFETRAGFGMTVGGDSQVITITAPILLGRTF